MAKENKKTILVTGGAGFIGSHLCERLVKGGHRVISLDNYFTGSKDNHVGGVEYIEGHTKDIEKHIKEEINIIFHLGEYARVEKSLEEPELVWELNKEGTFRVLEFCRKNKPKLVYAGSSTKYGDGGLGRDQSPYAWTKASNTELVRNYGEWCGINYAITYFYNVYGGKERSGAYGTVIAIFKEKFKKGESIPVVSPGTQVRNFTHINDIVDGLIMVGEKGHGDDYGLGDERGYSILEIAKMFGGEIDMLPERKGNRMESDIDTTKTRGLGWSPQRGVEDYIKDISKGL
ncbi:ADP-L-glycero-D-manno-heptose-6-epimerase [bacterium]|jgi:UDP-glucose 4-epimerase|nr:ADP-L-glycero-D-manno-heptose-6-epimerase [bacterium]MDP6659895.1 NAD-dependent epimerase/dehydratase family protein [Candidatus Paceibacterota bacterium]|tara:strand:- start:50421 stop:51287 length:867 start_codon:yes stop_codon:yes gene_type:complete